MIKHWPILVLLVLCCVGCGNAARKQQAIKARNAAVADKLKQQGEALQNQQGGDSATGNARKETP